MEYSNGLNGLGVTKRQWRIDARVAVSDGSKGMLNELGIKVLEDVRIETAKIYYKLLQSKIT